MLCKIQNTEHTSAYCPICGFPEMMHNQSCPRPVSLDFEPDEDGTMREIDPLAPAKGIFYALTYGTLIFALILVGVLFR